MLGLSLSNVSANKITATSTVRWTAGTKCVLLDSTGDFLLRQSSTANFYGNARINSSSTYIPVIGITDTLGQLGNFFCGDFSFHAWVKFTNDDAIEPIWSMSTSANVGIRFIKDGSNNLILRLDSTDISGGTDVAHNTWHNVIVTYSPTTKDALVYLNGNGTPEASNTNITWDGDKNMGYSYIGTDLAQSSTANDHMLGNVFEVAYWNKALTAAEVALVYNGGDPVNLADTFGLQAPLKWSQMGDFDLDSASGIYDTIRSGSIANAQFFMGGITSPVNGIFGANVTIVTDSPSS